jgi:hypothetical protein
MHALIGMNDGMDFYASLLPSRLRMTPNPLEDSVGEQCNSGGINDSQTFYPFFRAITSAVRGKFVLVRVIEVSVHLLKELL